MLSEKTGIEEDFPQGTLSLCSKGIVVLRSFKQTDLASIGLPTKLYAYIYFY